MKTALTTKLNEFSMQFKVVNVFIASLFYGL